MIKSLNTLDIELGKNRGNEMNTTSVWHKEFISTIGEFVDQFKCLSQKLFGEIVEPLNTFVTVTKSDLSPKLKKAEQNLSTLFKDQEYIDMMLCNYEKIKIKKDRKEDIMHDILEKNKDIEYEKNISKM